MASDKVGSRDSFALPNPVQNDGSHSQNTGLADLARGLQYVVNEAALSAHLHLQKTLDLFFTSDGIPIAREVQLPDGSLVSIPLLALTPPANLQLEEMEVSLAVRIDSMRPVSDMPGLQADPASDGPAAPAMPAAQSKPSAPSDKSAPPTAGTAQTAATAAATTAAAATAAATPGATTPGAASAGQFAKMFSEESEIAEGEAGPQKASANVQSFAIPFADDGIATRSRAPDAKPLERLSFEISPAPRSPDADARKDNNIMDIKMIFRRGDTPEGVARLVALFTDSMFRPQKT